MTRDLQKILKMLAEKYPANYDFENMINPALLIFDDESGRILKDASTPAYGSTYETNTLFNFTDIDELVKHLQEKTNDTASS